MNTPHSCCSFCPRPTSRGPQVKCGVQIGNTLAAQEPSYTRAVAQLCQASRAGGGWQPRRGPADREMDVLVGAARQLGALLGSPC